MTCMPGAAAAASAINDPSDVTSAKPRCSTERCDSMFKSLAEVSIERRFSRRNSCMHRSSRRASRVMSSFSRSVSRFSMRERELGRAALISGAVMARVRFQCALEPPAGVVEALVSEGKEIIGTGQAPSRRDHPGAAILEMLMRAAPHPHGKTLNVIDEIAAHGHRALGGRGGRRGAQVGGIIDQRPIGFVSDG